MARTPALRPANMDDLMSALVHSDECLGAMRREQIAYHEADSQQNMPIFRRSLRLFGENHYEFLNAAYTLGDYLANAAIRQFLRDQITPYLEKPISQFHRELRNSIDHRQRLEFGRSKNVEWCATIGPPSTFPIPSLLLAAHRGVLAYEQTPVKIGPSFLCYQMQHLEPQIRRILSDAKASEKFDDTFSVVLLAERYLEGLRLLVMQAEHRLKKSEAIQ